MVKGLEDFTWKGELLRNNILVLRCVFILTHAMLHVRLVGFEPREAAKQINNLGGWGLEFVHSLLKMCCIEGLHLNTAILGHWG
jgi:hypothetical protein